MGAWEAACLSQEMVQTLQESDLAKTWMIFFEAENPSTDSTTEIH